MTTHSPTTVSLVDNKNIFLLKYDKNGQLVINTVDSKYEVFSLLTENLVFVSEPVKLVFTEGDGKLDNTFYNHVKKIYFKYFAEKEELVPITFRSIGSKHFRQLFNAKLIENESRELEFIIVYLK